MSALSIPKQYEQGLLTIFSLPSEEITGVISALNELNVAMKVRNIGSLVASKVNIPKSKLEYIVNTITGLYLTQANLEVPTKVFVNDIIEALGEGQSSKALEIRANPGLYKEQLWAILNIDAMKVAIKAIEVLHEHQYTLRDIRIMSDVRPVFGDNLSDGPAAAVIIHTLKINYKENEEEKKFYLAMDDNDLKLLKENIARAEEKAEGLRALLSKANVNYLDLK